MSGRPLWVRLGIGFAAAATAIVMVTLVGAALVVRVTAFDSAADRASETAIALAEDPDGYFGPAGPGRRRAGLERLERLLATRGERVGLVWIDGSRAGAAGELIDPRTGLLIAQASEPTRWRVTGPGGSSVALVSAPMRSDKISAVLVARPIASAFPLGRVAVPVGMLVVVAAFGMGALISKRIVAPIDRIRNTADRIAEGDLQARTDVDVSGELGALASDIDRMATALEEARRRESEFLSNIAHELRSPITAIIGYAQALEDGTAADANLVSTAAATVRSEARRLDRLIDDVLALGKDQLPQNDPEPTDLVALARQAVEAHLLEAEAGGVSLEVDGPDELIVSTDPMRVRQILTNLITNAVRVTPGSGRVGVGVAMDQNGPVIEVSDTGPGIAPSDLPHVFERAYLFRAAGESGQKRNTGLGLAIVRQLATSLGAKIEVRSALGRGTVFTVRLPNS